MAENEHKPDHSVTNTSKPIFRELNADDSDPETIVNKSLCMHCGKYRQTTMFLTNIPYYKEVMLMSFECQHCGYQDNRKPNAIKVEERGVKIILKIISKSDLNRQIVESDYTSICIPRLDFKTPSQSQEGEITTVEGIIDRSINGLGKDQVYRRKENPEAAKKVDQILDKLRALKNVEEPFTIIFEDISGNTYVQNPNIWQKDEGCYVHYFKRIMQQNQALGIYVENEATILQSIDEEYSLE